MSYKIIVLYGVIAILLFDAAASTAAKALGFWYPYATIGSWVIYSATGALAARVASMDKAALAGAVVGFVESTFGWAVSWMIGPGRPDGQLARGNIFVAVVLVTLVATGIAWLGGVVG